MRPVGAVESLPRFPPGGAQRRPELVARLFQALQSRFAIGGVRLHFLDSSINVGAPLGCELCRCLVDSVSRLAPSLHLSGGDITEYSLLLLDPFVSCFTLANLVPTLRKGRGNYGRVN
jgi:hypothetical protein